MVLPTRDLSETSLSSIAELIEDAFDPADRNFINFHLFEALLLIFSKSLSLLERKVEVRFKSSHSLSSAGSDLSLTSVRIRARRDKKRKSIDQRRKSRDDRRKSRDDRETRKSRDDGDRRKSRDDRDKRKSRDDGQLGDAFARKQFQKEHEGHLRKIREDETVEDENTEREQAFDVDSKKKPIARQTFADVGGIKRIQTEQALTDKDTKTEIHDKVELSDAGTKKKLRKERTPKDASTKRSPREEPDVSVGPKTSYGKEGSPVETDEIVSKDLEYSEKGTDKELPKGSEKQVQLGKDKRKGDSMSKGKPETISSDESLLSKDSDHGLKETTPKLKSKQTKHFKTSTESEEDIVQADKTGKSVIKTPTAGKSLRGKDSAGKTPSAKGSLDPTKAPVTVKPKAQDTEKFRKMTRKSADASKERSSASSETSQTTVGATDKKRKTPIKEMAKKGLRTAIIESSETSEFEEENIVIVEKLPIGTRGVGDLSSKPHKKEQVIPQSLVTKEQLMKLVDEIIKLQERFSIHDDSTGLMKAFRKSASLTEPIAIVQLSNRLEIAEKALQQMLPVVQKLVNRATANKAMPVLGAVLPSAVETGAMIRGTPTSGFGQPSFSKVSKVPEAVELGTPVLEGMVIDPGTSAFSATVPGAVLSGMGSRKGTMPGITESGTSEMVSIKRPTTSAISSTAPGPLLATRKQSSAVGTDIKAPSAKTLGAAIPGQTKTGTIPPQLAASAMVSAAEQLVGDENYASEADRLETKSANKFPKQKGRPSIGGTSKIATEDAAQAVFVTFADKLGERASEVLEGGLISDSKKNLITYTDLRERLRDLEQEILQGIGTPASRAQSLSENALKLAELLGDKLHKAVNNDDKMAAVEELITAYAEKVNAIDTHFSAALTKYQEELSQMEHDLEVAIENMTELIGNRESDVEAITELNNQITSLQDDIDQTDFMQTDLKKVQNSLNLEIEALLKEIKIVNDAKSDRDEITKAFSTKAGIAILNGKVSLPQFEAVLGDFQKNMVTTFQLIDSTEMKWQKHLDDLFRSLTATADKNQVESFKINFDETIDILRKRLDFMLEVCGEPLISDITRQLIRDKDCLSCSTPVHELAPISPNRHLSMTYVTDICERQLAYLCPNHCGHASVTRSDSDASKRIRSVVDVKSLEKNTKSKPKVVESMQPCMPCNPRMNTSVKPQRKQEIVYNFANNFASTDSMLNYEF